MNKKGFIGILLFFVFLFLVLIIGFIAAIALGIVDFASDTITPIMLDLGVMGATNMSEAAQYTFLVVDNTIQALTWAIGFMYVVALISSVFFAVSYSASPHPLFIGVYLILVILLIFGAIIVSNMYENIYTGDDVISVRLQEQTLISYMILYSPFILTLIALLTGVYLFAKPPGGEGI